MHDVVAHSLTVMISLSDGAAVVVRKDPERAGAGAGRALPHGPDGAGGHAPGARRAAGGRVRRQAPRWSRSRPATSLGKLLDGFRTAGLPLHYSHTGPALPEDAASG